MEKIIQKEKIWYRVLHCLAFFYGVSATIVATIMLFVVGTVWFVTDAYLEIEHLQALSSVRVVTVQELMAVASASIIIALLIYHFRLVFSSFEKKNQTAIRRMQHTSLRNSAILGVLLVCLACAICLMLPCGYNWRRYVITIDTVSLPKHIYLPFSMDELTLRVYVSSWVLLIPSLSSCFIMRHLCKHYHYLGYK